MIPRKRLDISWSDLLIGVGYCLGRGAGQFTETQVEQLAVPRSSLVCLSVRSGFAALLQTLSFGPGTEILVSAIPFAA